jgi:hypothetical protein
MTGVSIRSGLLAAAAAVPVLACLAFRPTNPIPSKTDGPWKTASGSGPAARQFPPGSHRRFCTSKRPPRGGRAIFLRRSNTRRTSDRADHAADACGRRAIPEYHNTLVGDAGAGAHIAGLQIDYDCPTHSLKSYGGFLKQVRQRLPAGSSLFDHGIARLVRSAYGNRERTPVGGRIRPTVHLVSAARANTVTEADELELLRCRVDLRAARPNDKPALAQVRSCFETQEYWRAYKILTVVLEMAGPTPLGKRAAARAIACLRRFNSDRFGRVKEIHDADIRLSSWLVRHRNQSAARENIGNVGPPRLCGHVLPLSGSMRSTLRRTGRRRPDSAGPCISW